MKIIKTNKVSWFKAGAITIFPFIFIHPNLMGDWLTIEHEIIHYEQQKRWAIYGLGIGLIAWYMLYLLALPVGWNPFRYKWEMEAYTEGSLYSVETTKKILKQPPYYLWWM